MAVPHSKPQAKSDNLYHLTKKRPRAKGLFFDNFFSPTRLGNQLTSLCGPQSTAAAMKSVENPDLIPSTANTYGQRPLPQRFTGAHRATRTFSLERAGGGYGAAR